MEERVHRREHDDIIVERGPVLLRVYAKPQVERERLEHMLTILDDMLERFPAVGVVVLSEHGSGRPSNEDLRYLSERLIAYEGRVVFSLAVLGLGFWARRTIQVAFKISRMTGDCMLFDTSVEALVTRLGMELVGLDTDDLIARCHQLRAEVRAPASISV